MENTFKTDPAWWFQKVIPNNGFNTGHLQIEEAIDLTTVQFILSQDLQKSQN